MLKKWPYFVINFYSCQIDRLKLGEQELSKLDKLQVDRLKNAYGDFSPDLVKFTLEYGYADIFSRDNLALKYRQIAIIAALTALGNAQPQLKFHINAGLNISLAVTKKGSSYDKKMVTRHI